MESIIKIDDLYIIRDSNAKVEFTIVDEEDNPVEDGLCVVKLNNVTFFKGNVENGLFNKTVDFTDYKNEEYDLTVIYGGNSKCDPTDINVKLYLENPPENNAEEFIDDEDHVSIKTLQNASYRLTKWIDINKKLPGKIMINNQQVPISSL